MMNGDRQTLSKILEGMQKLLSTPGTWIKNYYAVDERGCPVLASSQTACKWCLSGAINRVALKESSSHKEYLRKKNLAVRYLAELIYDERLPVEARLNTVVEWNDKEAGTQDEVLALIRRARTELHYERTSPKKANR